MYARLLVIAAALTIGTSALAEPPKAPAKDSAPAASRPAGVVLASAVQVPPPAPAPETQAPAPAKKRVARVTTCRCAGQTQEQ